jgi:hypothetical protein
VQRNSDVLEAHISIFWVEEYAMQKNQQKLIQLSLLSAYVGSLFDLFINPEDGNSMFI